MRLPKLRGFKSKVEAPAVIYTGQLSAIKKTTIDNKSVFEAGLVANPYQRVKVILKGDVDAKLTVKLQSASTAAIAAIEKAGGSFDKTQRQARPAKPTADK